tara:strand:+ start:260 stop:448 length:189 start_codon:yes stop_codon:yes gene_type:complete
MPGKKKNGAYEMNHPNMMKPYQMGHSPNEMGHSPKQMKHSPMPMKGPYNMRPSILNQMSHNK